MIFVTGFVLWLIGIWFCNAIKIMRRDGTDPHDWFIVLAIILVVVGFLMMLYSLLVFISGWLP